MKRITSIDALRAFALYGILLIHARQGFAVGGVNYLNNIDIILGAGVKYLFERRFMLIFNILFGVSFYIILSKKDYPASKFVWRCFLLAVLGLFNRLIFNNDVLFKYGLCGMFLVPVRKMSDRRITYIALAFILAGVFFEWLELGDSVAVPFRYIEGLSLVGFLKTYPSSLLMLERQFLNGDVLFIYASMLIGYIMGRVGFIESMDSKLKMKHALIALVFYCFLGALFYGGKYFGVSTTSFLYSLFKYLFWYSGAFFYWILFIVLYNNKTCHSLLALLEPYGKLGLTNYSMQGFIGILLFYFCGLSKLGLSFFIIFLFATAFFLLQVLFSAVWLRFFRNGPLEYLWRCATSRRWLPLLVSVSKTERN